MHKLIRPNLIRRVARSAPQQTSESFVSGNNIQILHMQPPASTVNLTERDNAPFQVSVCICTLLHNDEQNFDTIIANIRSLQTMFQKSFVVFVESNSTDKTVEVFSKLENALFIHLESASESDQRNAYLSFVKKNSRTFDCMVVIDTSIALKVPLQKSSFSCFEGGRYGSWDAVFANQSYKYYDIQSLRSRDCPTDMSELPDEEKQLKIRNLRRHIPRDEKMIPVSSAFGGLAVYKVGLLEKCSYKADGHISFNILYNQQTPKMFIDPSLVLETQEANAHLYL